MSQLIRPTVRSRPLTVAVAAAVFAAFAGAQIVGASGPSSPLTLAAAHADEETPAEKVARLLPGLRSDNVEVRERAERELFALGVPGQTGLDRIARGANAEDAKLALHLLASDRWANVGGVLPGEQVVRKATESADAKSPDRESLKELLRRAQAEASALIGESERRIAELRRSLDKMGHGNDDPAFRDGLVQSGTSITNGNSISWKIDADGRVTVTTKDQGADEVVVTADSLEKLRAEHPELASRLDARRITFGESGWRLSKLPEALDIPELPNFDEMPEVMRRLYRDESGRLRLRESGDDEVAARQVDPAVTGPRLGISIDAVPDVLRDQLELPAGGLVVREVVKGSLAERLTLRRSDVLLSLAGRSVSTAADVIGALSAVPAGEKVTAEIVRKGRRETLSTTR